MDCQDGEADMHVKPDAKSRRNSKCVKTKPSSVLPSWTVRAEVISPDSFLIILEEPQLQGWKPDARMIIVRELEEVAQLAGASVEKSLAEEDRCELHAPVYSPLNQALVAAGRMLVNGLFFWLPLPFWVIEKLPSFGGHEIVHAQPACVWLPEGLMPYQQSAVSRALVQGGKVLLADEMGLGKTAEALAIVAQYLEQEGPVLILIPPSLGGVWKDQIRLWLPECSRSGDVQVLLDTQERVFPQARLVIISYTLFARKPKLYSTTPDAQAWKIVVCDEAHCLRNPSSQRTKAILPVLQAARRVVLVTGTPTPKQASEAYMLLHALQPLQCTFKEWCNRYGSGSTERREAEVAAMLAEVMVRRSKADVLDQLPPRHRQCVRLHLTASAAATVRKLQDSCTDDEHFRQVARLKEVAVQDYVEYLLDASSQKLVLFAHHRAMLNSLENIVSKKSVQLIRIDGSTPMVERAGLVRRFQIEPACRVAVLSVLAAGEGLSFTAASICVFCELCPAVPGVIEQAEARIHRIGQQASYVDVHFLVVDGTRDDRVFARLESRTGAVAQAVGDLDADAGLLACTRGELLESLDHRDREQPPFASLTCVNSILETPRKTQTPCQTRQFQPSSEHAQSSFPRKKRQKPGFDLGSVLDREIARAQAGIEAASSRSDGNQSETGMTTMHVQSAVVSKAQEPVSCGQTRILRRRLREATPTGVPPNSIKAASDIKLI